MMWALAQYSCGAITQEPGANCPALLFLKGGIMKDTDEFESIACNCVEVGTIIREDDTVLTINLSGVNAHSDLETLKAEAAEIGSGNCKVTTETIDENGQTAIRAMFDFDCTAEKLIFQMKHA